MAELKTKRTEESPEDVLARIEDLKRREECRTLLRLMEDATGQKPEVWGPGIFGFGAYKYKSGKNMNEWFLTGFASRKQNLTIYLMSGFAAYGGLMKKLGPHKTAVGCLHMKSLDDIDMSVLKELVERSTADFKKNYLRK